MKDNHEAFRSGSSLVSAAAVAHASRHAGHHLRWLPAIAVGVLLAACGSRGPSIDQATEAIKDMPQFRLLLGAAADSQKFRQLQLISDLKCNKVGDGHFACEVLMRKNPITGLQQAAAVDFVKLGGEWRATATN